MKAKWFLRVMVGSGGLLLTERAFAESVVYDNTRTYDGTSVPVINLEWGSEITLTGTERVVRAVSIVVEVDGKSSAAFTAWLSLYVNDGQFGGSPGTLLWRSDVIPQQIEPGAPRVIRFAVPGVRVSNTFIWIIGFGAWETPISLSQFYPPAVGSVRFGAWRDSLGPTPWLFYEGLTPFGALVTVDSEIPAISSWGVLLLTLALVGAGTVVLTRANRRGTTGCTVGGAALLAAISFFAWTSSAFAQVQVDPQIRIDVNGGTAAANETSMASSYLNANEIVASWNDWRQGPTGGIVRMGVGVSHDGGATWTDFLVRPPIAYQNNREGDPMTAYDD